MKQNLEAYQLRYVFDYAMEGSDLACYILWPTRTAEQSFWCIDAWKGDWVGLDSVLTWLRWQLNTSRCLLLRPTKTLEDSRNSSSGHPFLPLGSHKVGALWEGTLSTTKEVQRGMSNVACEGSHMKDFGGVGLVDRNHLIPSPF